MGDGRDQTSEQKKNPPLQKAQGWGTLRVFLAFGGVEARRVKEEEPSTRFTSFQGKNWCV